MNKVQLVGRLTKDPEISVVGENQTPFVKFTVAVDRRFKDANGNKQTDFINCVGWKTTAQFVSNYFHKGQRIGLSGSIQTRTYDDPQTNKKVYVTEVLAEEAEFVESKTEVAPAPTLAPVAPKAPSITSFPVAPKAPPQNVTLEDLAQYGELPFEV